MELSKRLRVGVDVGGTFTKAVAVDADTMEIVAVSVTPTTHTAKEGVALGVVTVFNDMLQQANVSNESVVFIAHSTTQATNALLEGDVSSVGIIAMANNAFDAMAAKSQTIIDNVEVAPGKYIPIEHIFVDTTHGLSHEKAHEVVTDLKNRGANAIVASEVFSVDNPQNEITVMNAAKDVNLPATGAHEITSLYGLKVRTRTAVINASILNKMIETADMTEKGIRMTGVTAPLMVMRGDGGVMDINEMRQRPILTALSGPAASVAGFLFYLTVSNGIYFEVGGTSTNIGVIKNGRPMVHHVQIGGHSTYLPSLDVRVLGVAGGSMARVGNNRIIDVGPRSAHIAGLSYSAFADPSDIQNPKLVNLALKEGDPKDYVGIECENGKRFALTNTCAGNVLGLVQPGDYSYGNPESARKAFEPLAKALGMSVENAARAFLDKATEKIINVINSLIKEYNLDEDGSVLVGGGGGAIPIVKFISEKTGLRYQVPENAEVISSIGDALAMVREVVERSIIDPKPEDVVSVRKEAEQRAITSGAVPGSIEIFVEVDKAKNRVIAIAVGATEFVAKELSQEQISEEQKAAIVAESMHLELSDVQLVATTQDLSVYTGQKMKRFLFLKIEGKTPVRVIDHHGTVRLAIKNGVVFQTVICNVLNDIKKYTGKYLIYTEAAATFPATFICFGARIFDLSGMTDIQEAVAMCKIEVEGLDPEMPAVILISPQIGDV